MEKQFDSILEIAKMGLAEIRDDSRKVGIGDIFVAMPGTVADGAQYIKAAANSGAKYIVCEQAAAEGAMAAAPGCAIVPVANVRDALLELAQARWGCGNLNMKIIGITGTNGKTTCAWLLEYLFSALGCKTGLLGTIKYSWPGYSKSASLTTPGTLELHAMLADMAAAGAQMAVMEVSSHSLAQKRIAGINFSGAIFTNLTQDHLDYHHDMESYFRSKAKLFLDWPFQHKAMAINADDRYGRRLLELLPTALAYSLSRGMPRQRCLYGQIESLTPAGMRLKMTFENQAWELETPLVGAFNAANLLAVQALCLEMGINPGEFKLLEKFNGVPGRLERIENERDLNIFVDYAHTPDALANALQALRQSGFKRIITVFGCGGNRDRDKRPLMGKAVSENSDIAILTSDNPRQEDPEAIMRDVKPGLTKARQAFYEVDRKAATIRALEMLNPADALLIAGKGHEDYQIIGLEKRHYSDQEVVREYLNCI